MAKHPIAERAFIRSLRTQAPQTKGPLRLGIGDDCAILRPPANAEIVATTDFSLETKHFRRDWHPPQSAGHRCLARGLSDLAAMGATPLAAFLSLAIPQGMDKKYVDGFLKGLLSLAKQTGVPLAGGDTASAPAAELLADITLLGTVPRGKALLRSGARPGDAIYVTGQLGAAAAELEHISSPHDTRPSAPKSASATHSSDRKRASASDSGPTVSASSRPSGPKARAILAWGNAPGKLPSQNKSAEGATYSTSSIDAGKNHPHLFPQPRLAAGQALLKRNLATAAIDISDGLSVDLLHLCEESGVDAEIQTVTLPLGGTLAQALHGGEDYELLFTSSKPMPSKLGGVAITCIGTVLPRTGRTPRMWLVRENGKRSPLRPQGWEHQL